MHSEIRFGDSLAPSIVCYSCAEGQRRFLQPGQRCCHTGFVHNFRIMIILIKWTIKLLVSGHRWPIGQPASRARQQHREHSMPVRAAPYSMAPIFAVQSSFFNYSLRLRASLARRWWIDAIDGSIFTLTRPPKTLLASRPSGSGSSSFESRAIRTFPILKTSFVSSVMLLDSLIT